MLVAGLGGARGCLEGVFWADFRSLPPLSCHNVLNINTLSWRW